MVSSTQLKYVLFQLNDISAWALRLLILFLIVAIIYVCIKRFKIKFDFSKKISPELEEEENTILKQLQQINREGNVLKEKKKLLKKQIDDIIEQGIELKRLEECIEIKKQEIKPQKKEAKIEEENEEKRKKDVQQFLKMIDNWLEKLPEKTINEFSKSKDFELYKSILGRYRVK